MPLSNDQKTYFISAVQTVFDDNEIIRSEALDYIDKANNITTLLEQLNKLAGGSHKFTTQAYSAGIPTPAEISSASTSYVDTIKKDIGSWAGGGNGWASLAEAIGSTALPTIIEGTTPDSLSHAIDLLNTAVANAVGRSTTADSINLATNTNIGAATPTLTQAVGSTTNGLLGTISTSIAAAIGEADISAVGTSLSAAIGNTALTGIGDGSLSSAVSSLSADATTLSTTVSSLGTKVGTTDISKVGASLSAAVSSLGNKVGTTDISAVGDGSLSGAIGSVALPTDIGGVTPESLSHAIILLNAAIANAGSRSATADSITLATNTNIGTATPSISNAIGGYGSVMYKVPTITDGDVNTAPIGSATPSLASLIARIYLCASDAGGNGNPYDTDSNGISFTEFQTCLLDTMNTANLHWN